MSILQAVILGVIEGITEFLPISSTGHLILAADLLRIPETDFLKTFEIAIQLGAILAVVSMYWRRVTTNLTLVKKIAVAFIPTGIIGLAAYPFLKSYLLGNEQVVLWSLFLGGVAIFAFEKYFPRQEAGAPLEAMTYRQAMGIGLAQAVAIVPGVSRAAATILGGLAAGLNRQAIVEFSFLLAIPTMAAATGLDLIQAGPSFSSREWLTLGVGFVVSFTVALAAVKWLLRYVQTHDFTAFGIYRIALALVFWLLLL